MITEYQVRVKVDAYSMPLYECTNMTEKEVEDYLLENNCLEPNEYELIISTTEEDDDCYSYDDYPTSCIENC